MTWALRLSYLFCFVFLGACTTQNRIADKYQALGPQGPTSKRTVLFFLIDGLQIRTVAQGIKHQRLPQLKKFFVDPSRGFHFARTTFPSLTYPAIVSLLTEKPIDQNGIYGNTIIQEDEKISFERN